MTAEAWFTLLANGTIGAISYTGPLALADTGAEATPAVVAARHSWPSGCSSPYSAAAIGGKRGQPRSTAFRKTTAERTRPPKRAAVFLDNAR